MRKLLRSTIAFVSLSALSAAALAADNYLSFPGKSGPGKGKTIVFIAGDEEYRSEEGLPMLAKILSQEHGFNCDVLFSMDPTGSYVDPNNHKSVTHIESVDNADLIIIQTRFREWGPEEYDHLYKYLNAGKPFIGLRTATHAFTGSGKTDNFKWSEFGLKILGETWVNHHGQHKKQGTRGVIEEANANHPILKGVKDVFGASDVYTVSHLDESKDKVLLRGAVTETLDPTSKPIDGPKNNPMMPVAWVHDYTAPNGTAHGKSFCTTMGASVDLQNEDLRRLIVNAAYFLVNLPVPDKAEVKIIDPYNPSFFGFNNAPDFYKNRNMQVSEQALGRSGSTGTGK